MQRFFPHLFDGHGVFSKILLQAYQDDGHAEAPFVCLFDPLVFDVLQGVRRVDCKGNEEYMGLGVGQRPQSLVVFLTRGIPER